MTVYVGWCIMYSKVVIIICKFFYRLLKIFGMNGGNAIGLLAVTLNKNILKYFKIKGKIISVTGTNGKTFTTNLVRKTLKSTNKKVISNKEGNNIDTGIISLFIKNCDLNGNINSDYLVLEIDEHYLPIIYKTLKLDTLIVLNFFRDQLDRAGETETIIQKINNFLKTYNGNLILNADDPNVLRLGNANKENQNIYYYNVEKYEGACRHMHDKGEGRFCPFCSSRLKYKYYQYSHVGKFECPGCGFGNVTPNTTITHLDLQNGTFKCDNKTFKTRYNTIYTMYNISSVLCLCKIYDIPSKLVHEVIKNFQIDNGRMETLLIKDNITTLNLVKNPTGATVTLRYMNEDSDTKELLFVLNDNIADGKDVSWIWDINFTVLNKVDRVITSGTRAYDMAVRIKNSGYNFKKIECYPKIEEAVHNLYKTENKKYIIMNYTAVNETRNTVINYKNRVDSNDI